MRVAYSTTTVKVLVFKHRNLHQYPQSQPTTAYRYSPLGHFFLLNKRYNSCRVLAFSTIFFFSIQGGLGLVPTT